eukprot:Amastigsp_a513637_15.p3 type:complete len:133 gc:universal Amastigsp_a513637_15:554-156(-)
MGVLLSCQARLRGLRWPPTTRSPSCASRGSAETARPNAFPSALRRRACAIIGCAITRPVITPRTSSALLRAAHAVALCTSCRAVRGERNASANTSTRNMRRCHRSLVPSATALARASSRLMFAIAITRGAIT